MIKAVHILILGTILLSTSCYREEVVLQASGETFEMVISPELHAFLLQSKDTTYTLDDPGIQLLLNDFPLDLKEIRTRGKNALNFPRKSYSVFLKHPVYIEGRNGRKGKLMDRFKLLAMAMDYTYIENRVGLGLLEQSGVTPLFFKYVEFGINGETKGVYMLVEDPEEFARELGSEYILRRGYNHWIADAEYKPSFNLVPMLDYQTIYNDIYRILLRYEGEELYEQLDQRLNITNYFRKMGIDYLLSNGDYTDEIFFYALISGEQIRYNIIPWDYDDLFSEQPHEVGVSWTGTLFGKRYYPTHQDVLNEIGDKLIFSIEDDLDYCIAKDSFLYARYEEELSTLVHDIEKQGFERLFQTIRSELGPYYQDEEIVAQSQYDRNPSSQKKWEENMTEKQAYLEERLRSMKEQLNSAPK